MLSPSPLSESEQKLVRYFEQNLKRAEFAVARRQQWPKLLKMLDKCMEALQVATIQTVQQKHLATAFQLAAGGFLTEAQIRRSPMLSEAQQRDVLATAQMHERQRVRLMEKEKPAVGQRITAKFKPDSYLGKYGSWHTGNITLYPNGPGFDIVGTGGVPLDDIICWLPTPDEEPHDVEKRQHHEQYALDHPDYLTHTA